MFNSHLSSKHALQKTQFGFFRGNESGALCQLCRVDRAGRFTGQNSGQNVDDDFRAIRGRVGRRVGVVEHGLAEAAQTV